MTEDWKNGADGSWDFGAIGEGFDAHVRRHLPGYELVEELAVSAALWNVYEGSRVLDIGCATGTTLAALAGRSRVWFDGRGIDVEQDMVNAALANLAAADDGATDLRPVIGVYQMDATHLGLQPTARVLGDEPFDVVFALFSLQFVPTPARWCVLRFVRENLARGGLFVLAEKCLASSPRGADLYSGLYSDWKLQNAIPSGEILAKWSSLRGRLIPWPADRYEAWAREALYEIDLLWAWGPFRAWAMWAREDVAP